MVEKQQFADQLRAFAESLQPYASTEDGQWTIKGANRSQEHLRSRGGARMKVDVPPIKSQGIKTKLVPWIRGIIPEDIKGRWIEPFMGTGVVGFNVARQRALMCDTNPHLIAFYNAIKAGEITAGVVKDYLNTEGGLLSRDGEAHYYAIRDRFNREHHPLDFLFVNRSGFNGMIRFNKKGGFNTPFCRKENRFAQAYVTKIANQIDRVSKTLSVSDFVFKCQSFEATIKEASANDVVYCDPPYIDRHVDYYGGWNEGHERKLFELLDATKARFVLSTWHHNDYRRNEYIDSLWSKFNVYTREHFYHVGAKEKNRNPMVEAIITNYEVAEAEDEMRSEQLRLITIN